MARKSTSQHRVKVERIFKVPVGAEEAFTSAGNDRFLSNETDGGGVGGAPSVFIDLTGVGTPEFLQAPNLFSVIDQRLRRGPGGQLVVDIIIEVEDVPGANEYEAHVTEAVL